MDTTDIEPHPDPHPERFTMPDDYAECRTIEAANETYKALWAIRRDLGLDPNDPTQRPIVATLMENHRRALVILSSRANGKKLPGQPTVKREHVPRAVLSEDGTQITCVGPCGETKNIKKFPTVSGSPGVREGRCRDCRDAAKAEAKVSA